LVSPIEPHVCAVLTDGKLRIAANYVPEIDHSTKTKKGAIARAPLLQSDF